MGHAELEPKDIDESVSAFYGAFKRTCAAFCATTSIHGVKYFRDEETNKVVRFVWVLITILMFICAVIMVVTFYMDYRSNPTRMNVESDHVPISLLTFPAITICPEVLYNMEKSKRFIDTIKLPPNITSDDVLKAINIGYGFVNDDERLIRNEVRLMERILKLNNFTMYRLIGNFRWSCKDMLFRCRYRSSIVDCDELFQFTRAYYGSCCGFNVNQTGLNYKRRPAEPGMISGLSIILYYNDSMYDQVRSYSYGFKMLLNENDAFPSTHAVTKYIPLGQEAFLSVRPIQTVCSKAVRNLPFEDRQCVFPEEYPLTFFRSYVGSNCELDCRLKQMIKTCGCITFYHDIRRTEVNGCTYKDIPCIVENFADIIGRYRNTQCSCPSSCESIEYDVQLTTANLQVNIPTVDMFYDGIKKEYSVAHIYMNSNVFRRVRHDLLSNTITLVSNLGSAFSLFVGMSMVSAVEILYYFTVILRKYYVQEVKARKKILFHKNDKLQLEQSQGD